VRRSAWPRALPCSYVSTALGHSPGPCSTPLSPRALPLDRSSHSATAGGLDRAAIATATLSAATLGSTCLPPATPVAVRFGNSARSARGRTADGHQPHMIGRSADYTAPHRNKPERASMKRSPPRLILSRARTLDAGTARFSRERYASTSHQTAADRGRQSTCAHGRVWSTGDRWNQILLSDREHDGARKPGISAEAELRNRACRDHDAVTRSTARTSHT